MPQPPGPAGWRRPLARARWGWGTSRVVARGAQGVYNASPPSKHTGSA